MQLRPIAIARWVLCRTVELEVAEVLGEWQFSDGELVYCVHVRTRKGERTKPSIFWPSPMSLFFGFSQSLGIFDRSRLLLVDVGGEQVADDALRLMLAFDGRGHDLIEGGLHAIELEFAHKVE